MNLLELIIVFSLSLWPHSIYYYVSANKTCFQSYQLFPLNYYHINPNQQPSPKYCNSSEIPMTLSTLSLPESSLQVKQEYSVWDLIVILLLPSLIPQRHPSSGVKVPLPPRPNPSHFSFSCSPHFSHRTPTPTPFYLLNFLSAFLFQGIHTTHLKLVYPHLFMMPIYVIKSCFHK